MNITIRNTNFIFVFLISQVKLEDAAAYRCRVDFFSGPTRNVKVKLSLIGTELLKEMLLI